MREGQRDVNIHKNPVVQARGRANEQRNVCVLICHLHGRTQKRGRADGPAHTRMTGPAASAHTIDRSAKRAGRWTTQRTDESTGVARLTPTPYLQQTISKVQMAEGDARRAFTRLAKKSHPKRPAW